MNGKYLAFIGTAIALAFSSNVAVAQAEKFERIAQSGQPPTAKPFKLSPEGKKILCQNFPLNSACAQTGGTGATQTPSSGSSDTQNPSKEPATGAPNTTTPEGTSTPGDSGTPGVTGPGGTVEPSQTPPGGATDPSRTNAPGGDTLPASPSGTTGTPDSGTGTQQITPVPPVPGSPDSTGAPNTTTPEGTSTPGDSGTPGSTGPGSSTTPSQGSGSEKPSTGDSK